MTLPYPSFSAPPEAYQPSDPPSTCDPDPKPGVVLFQQFVVEHLGGGEGWITRPCTRGGASHHHEGRAWDWMLDVNDPEDDRRAEALFGWLFAPDDHGEPHAMLRRAGIDYLIWNKQIWNARTKTWAPYGGFNDEGICTATGGCRNPHTDHVHISFGWPGARAETSLYDWILYGPAAVDPEPRPDPVQDTEPIVEPPGVSLGAIAAGLAAATGAYLAVRAAQRSSSGLGRKRATRSL